MKDDNKRWLMSMMKTSGSKRERIQNDNYSEERHLQKKFELEHLPQHESIKSTWKFYNNKVNYGLLIRFLRGAVGNDWDETYSEIVSRIPTKLLDYKDIVFDFVAIKVEIIDGKIWNKKSQKFIWRESDYESMENVPFELQPEFVEFYVDPETSKLMHIQQKSIKRIYKK